MYAGMDYRSLFAALGDDGKKWAAAFCEITRKQRWRILKGVETLQKAVKAEEGVPR